jgi:hypothetical protein
VGERRREELSCVTLSWNVYSIDWFIWISLLTESYYIAGDPFSVFHIDHVWWAWYTAACWLLSVAKIVAKSDSEFVVSRSPSVHGTTQLLRDRFTWNFICINVTEVHLHIMILFKIEQNWQISHEDQRAFLKIETDRFIRKVWTHIQETTDDIKVSCLTRQAQEIGYPALCRTSVGTRHTAF